MRICRLLVLLHGSSVLAAVKVTTPLKLAPWTTIRVRGGSAGKSDSEQHQDHNHNGEEILETYVASMEQKDASSSQSSSSDAPKNGSPDDAGSSASASASAPPQSSSTENNDDSAILGIKAHKKSNAVGDPDGDSDDDSDDTEEEWQELEDFLDEQQPPHDHHHQVQVQVELLPDTASKESATGGSSTSTSTGGVKSVGRAAARSLSPKKKRGAQTTTTTTTSTTLEAWLPHIYMPPSHENLQKLQQQARTVDAFGKTRLDRRTLYAGLLLEWHNRGDRRKFLHPDVAQQLQAALSLATQPQWRQAAPQSSGITLQQGGTLSMQETIAMALVRKRMCSPPRTRTLSTTLILFTSCSPSFYSF
jgi:hypothetical protein